MAKIPIAKAVEIALEQHQAGNLARAEALYMEILRQDPGNVDAIHLLGVLALQGKAPESAVQLISAALRKTPDVPIFHYNLAEAYDALGKKQEALEEYTRAAELDPEYVAALNNRANLLNEARRFDEAEASCRSALAVDPKDPAVLNNFANALRGQRKIPEAIESYRAAIKERPAFLAAMSNLAGCLCLLGCADEGIALFKEVIQLNPALADSHNNLGAALIGVKRFEEAGQYFQGAIDLNPKHFQALNNLGAVLRTLARPHEALPFLRDAVELSSDSAEARSNLAACLKETGQHAEALEHIDKVVELRPEAAPAHFLRGVILRDLTRYDEGIEALEKTLQLEPNHAGTLAALGYAYQERGQLEESMKILKRSIEINPDPGNHSNVLLVSNYHPGYSPKDLFEAHKGWAALHETPLRENWPVHKNDRSPDRKLRVGYVSPDFRNHSVSFFLGPILEHHDHSQFEIYGYAHLAGTDMQTWRVRSLIDQWREISGLQPDEVARQILSDEIDILVEVAGHTANNALQVFARKPAPVQINMIGFPSTTGLSAIDYRITDALCDPPGRTDEFNTEELIRMPRIFWCYEPPDQHPDIGPLPAMETGTVTFVSTNNLTKITPDVQKMWASVLKEIPRSRLIIQTNATASMHTQKAITSVFARQDVSADRLIFRKATDMQTYLRLMERSDMALDPFPFNGGTTTCHSLWMGAPVITLAGDRHASRMGLSMMTAIGLPEFVAYTPQDYVRIAVEFANDLPRLQEIRAGMRDRLKSSPLLDAAGYTRELEAKFRTVWKKWCDSGKC
jgi:protein O-GlcNAc transferase